MQDPRLQNSLMKAQSLFQEGRLDQALAECQRVLAQAPQDAEALHLAGKVCQVRNDPTTGIDYLLRAIQIAPKRGEFWSTLGALLAGVGQAQRAGDAFRHALHLEPASPRAHLNWGEWLLSQANWGEAESAFAAALMHAPGDGTAIAKLGVALHQQKRYPEACQRYRQALQLAPRDATLWCDLGLALTADGQLPAAEDAFRKATQLQPELAFAHGHLGQVLLKQQRPDEAVICLNRAASLNPKFLEVHTVLGQYRAEKGQYVEALAAFEKARAIAPDRIDLAGQCAKLLIMQQRLPEAESLLRGILQNHPNAVEPLQDLAAVCSESDRHDEAIALLERVVALEPTKPEHHNALAGALIFAKQLDRARANLEQAIRIAPNFAHAYFNLGNLDRELGQEEAAMAHFRRAVEIAPDYVDAHLNLGVLLGRQLHWQQAEACFRTALQHQPQNAFAWLNLGVAQQAQNRLDEAAISYRKACDLDAKLAVARNNLGLTLLLQGHWKDGWPGYEYRLASGAEVYGHSTKPQWNGQPLAGKKLLVLFEQGIGDLFLGLRFLPLLRAQGAETILMVPRMLQKLLEGQPIAGRLAFPEEPETPHDYCVPIMSLPGRLQLTTDTVPWPGNYLAGRPERIAYWKDRLRSIPGFRVGIAWQGNAGFYSDRSRSIPLERFAPLAKVANVSLINLQKRVGLEQLDRFRASWPIHDFGSDLDEQAGAFCDSAALLPLLDLVICSDSAIAHLAGATGAKVWLALSQVPDWRWLRDRDDTPWYPTMKLFRQRELGNWAELFERIVRELVKASGRR